MIINAYNALLKKKKKKSKKKKKKQLAQVKKTSNRTVQSDIISRQFWT